MHKDVINIPFSVFTGHMNFTSGCCDHIRKQILVRVAFLCAFKDSSFQVVASWNFWQFLEIVKVKKKRKTSLQEQR